MANEAATGTAIGHYSPAKAGPFECHACVHFHFPHLCSHSEIIKAAKLHQEGMRVTRSNGFAIVEPGGCCEYQRKS